MSFFKYYRPNFYFEKAIRYNELYFSANNELNDPHDLKANFYFEDSLELWEALLKIKPEYETWDLSIYLKLDDLSLLSSLNAAFKNVSFDSLTGTIHEELEKLKDRLLQIFAKHIRSDVVPPKGFEFYATMPDDQKAENCVIWLSALLARAVSQVFYSVSFSDSALSPMMWAHYADGFKGCVVIYGSTPEGIIGLNHNLFDKDLMSFKFLKVNYIDGDKRVPVLECAIQGQVKTQEAFLQKNAFWDYESEYRLFSVEQSNPTMESITKTKKTSPRARILHHRTNDIQGVIFGPRCDESLKNKVDLTLLDNRRRAGNKPFFLFDTRLTLDGRVVISGAKKQCCTVIPGHAPSPGGLHQIIAPEHLSSLMEFMGIVEHSKDRV